MTERRLSEGSFGRSGKPLRELTDRELSDELRARRRNRASQGNASQGNASQNVSRHDAAGNGAQRPASTDHTADEGASLSWRRVKQYFANLELDTDAGLQEVERAYQRLRDRYHPDKHKESPQKLAAAKELSESLTEAYESVKRYLKKEDPRI